MAVTTIDNRIRLNIPVEFDISKKLVPAYVGSHFFNEQGEYKAYKLRQPSRKYSEVELISHKVDLNVVKALKKLTKWVVSLEGVEAVYTKRRLGFRTNFYFLKVEIRRQKLILEIKSAKAWNRYGVYNYKEVENCKEAVIKAHKLSLKPVIVFM